MPSFLNSLRRRSRSSIRTDGSNSASNKSTNGIGSSKSTSTLNSIMGSTPPSTDFSKSSSNLGSQTPPPIPIRPSLVSSQSNRYSIAGMPTNGSQPKPGAPASPLAPQVLNISDGSWVHQKVFLIFGQIGNNPQQPIDGTLVVAHHQDNFPQTSWPAYDSYFKALVYLQPGPNRIRLDFYPPRSKDQQGYVAPHSTWININSLPMNASPPLQLAILVARDSPQTFDAPPDRVQREGNGLDVAIRKYRMAAYLWQAFTGEQMQRNGFGRRVYRYEEEWQPGTLTIRDAETGMMRNEAKIHVIRLDQSVKEIRDLDKAQQYDRAKDKGALFGIASDAVKKYFGQRPGQKQYVSCMFLDSQWDKKNQTIRGHAALGGGDDELKLAIFGSQALHVYPTSMEEVVPVFTDTRRTDTNFVANDCDESGSVWEAANIGIGAHLHETGHLLGCPHQESGVMMRDYVRLNRTFVCRESFCTRTNSPGQRLCLPHDECNWHRLDCLRFKHHPCFRLPTDSNTPADEGIQVWTVENNTVLATSSSGIAWIELFTDGDDICHSWIEYGGDNPNSSNPRQVTLSESELRSRLPPDSRNKKFGIKLFSVAQGEFEVKDFNDLSSKASRVKLPDGRWGFRAGKLGASSMDGSQPQEIVLESFFIQTKLLTSIRVYHGLSVDGIEFFYEDRTSQLFGKRGGTPGGSEFLLDVRRGEVLMGFYLRAGAWIDGLQVLTSLGRRSEIFGNPTGGSGHTLIPPRGYSIAGIFGSCGDWLDGFGLIISR